MSKKDLFKSQNPNKFIGSANLDKLKEDVESKRFIKEKVKQDKLFTPRTDFSNPDNFARYGLAEEYYRTSMENVYKTYPYDGSRAERQAWYNSGSYLDQYVFDNEYPTTTGYIILGDENWGSQAATAGDYAKPSTDEYITFNGGPHGGFGSLKNPRTADIDGERGGSLANYYKASKNRENNLKLDISEGVTVEFWLKKGAFNNALTSDFETIFDLWNGEVSSSGDYGRLTIEMKTDSDPSFRVTCQSGTTGFFQQQLGSTTRAQIADNSWHHYAFSFVSASTGGIQSTLYRDGHYLTDSSLGTAFGAVVGTMSASIGALRTAPSGNTYHGTTMNGYGKVLSSSLDEFRYWKTERSAKEIFQNYNFQVGGGTNTDDANTKLGVYYKFNEGITEVDYVDSVVLDYSGRVTNGHWVGYSAGTRNTGSAIVSSSTSLSEQEDPIIYNFHPSVSSVKKRLEQTGSVHDNQNNSALFFTMPSWIIEEDESYGGKNLRYLTQIMSSYLDTLYLQTEEITKLKEVSYTSGAVKPSAFGDRFLSDKGMLSPELFVDANIVEKLYDRNENTNFTKDLSEVKNKIYENIHNNLVQIYKSKGTYDSFRNVLNTLGVSQKVVDINLYANNSEYEILDNRRQILERKKKLNFFKSDYNAATVYQATGSLVYGDVSQTLSYIPTIDANTGSFTPWTMESRFTLPRDNINSNYYFIENNNLTCSLFGYDEPHDITSGEYIWSTTNTGVHVYALRDRASHKDGYFYLSSSNDGTSHHGITLTSSVIPNLFDDTEWNIAVRFVPVKNPLETFVSGGIEQTAPSDPTQALYQFEFKGYSLRGGVVDQEFEVSSDQFDHSDDESGKNYSLITPKRMYVGAHRTNWTGSVYNDSNTFAKFHNFNFWLNYVSDDDLISHLKDPKNYGISKTYQFSQDSFFERGSQNSLYISGTVEGVPNIDTLALRWDFETVTGSDPNGQFVALDTTTAGSTAFKYGNFGAIAKQYQYPGRGDFFTANATDVVKTELINSYKLSKPDTILSDQMIEIRNDDDEIFLPDKRPAQYFFAAEKSFYNAIDEKIIETFSTLKDFNNLIGESANRYRPEYKDLKKYRRLFFERIENDLDFEKFVEYYKWVDSSITTIISQLTPASADISPELSNVVESHMLERNKYQHRLPVIKPMTSYGDNIHVGPNSYKYSTKGQISQILQNENPITSSIFLTASLNVSSVNASELTGTIKNVIDLTYRNIATSSYIEGDDNFNTIGVTRTKPKDRKGGNFSENYSVIVIPNKDGNSDLLLDPFQSVVPVADSFTVSGVVDYTLPNRPSQPSVITPRFSAPGGPEVNSLGYLDYETAQYSVYNSMNYRNLVVRKALEEMRTSASNDPTLFDDAADAASYNQNYRNPYLEYMSGGADPGSTASVFYDNAFINHPIPASDLQYSWITASYESATFLTRQTGSEDIAFHQYLPDFGHNAALDTTMPINTPFLAAFLDGRVYASILNADDGLFPDPNRDEYSYEIPENLYALDSQQQSIGYNNGQVPGDYPLNANYTDLAGGSEGAAGGTTINNQEAVRFWLNSVAPYGFNPWNMLRNRDGKQLFRVFNKHNILSVAEPIVDKEVIDTTSAGIKKKRMLKGIVPNTVRNYIEPAITRKFKPLVHTLILNNQNSDIVKVKSSYASKTAGFANKNLNALLDVDTKRSVSSYDKVKNLYLNSPDPNNSTIKGWLSVEYSEMVWPKEIFQGVNSNRDKPHYDTYAFPTLLNSRLGYMANRTFWRDSAYDRKRTTIRDGVLGNSQNSLGTVYDTQENLDDGTLINGGNFSKNIFPLSDYSIAANSGNVGQVAEIRLTFTADVTASATSSLAIGYLGIDNSGRSFEAGEYIGNNLTGTPDQAAAKLIALINGDDTVAGGVGINSLFTASNPGGTGNVIIQTRYPIGDFGTDYLGNEGLALNNWIKTDDFNGIITPNSSKVYFSGGTAPQFNRDAELNSSFLAMPEMVSTGSGINPAFHSYREEGYFGTHGVESEHYPDGVDAVDPYIFRPVYAYYFPQAAQTYFHRPRVAVDANLVEVAPYSGHPWKVAELSGRNPFFDSYHEYVKFPKFLTENYSIISEFNISDHLEYYEDEGNNLRAENKKILEIAGAKGKRDPAGVNLNKYLNTSSAESHDGAYNVDFFRNYSYSELLQKFNSVKQDHSKVGSVGTISLTCKALQKFRPKQGFYPIQRCLQLGSLFSQSVGGQLSGYVSSSVQYDYDLDQFKMQSAIQPFFSPGIVYNSVKSGIAVDWPIIFSGSVTTIGNTDLLPSSSLLVNTDASKRIPFEALTDLNQFPTNIDIAYLYPSYHSGAADNANGARRPFFNWNGNKDSNLFEAGMDNFLAEVPNFYLENKNYTEFTSFIEDKFKAFESGKTYYMDVAVRQTDKHSMWKDYFDGLIANNESYTGSYNGRAFGPGWATSSANDSPVGSQIGSDPSYAPYTPPYFYGESVARFAFTPTTSRKYTLDEITAGSVVEYLTPNLLTGISGSRGVFDVASDASSSPYYTNRMTVSSSLNLYGKIRTKPDSPDTSFNVWRISPKFECPIMNFENQESELYMSRGMWGGLGEIPKGNEGVYLTIKDSFTGSIDTSATGSLADQLGFSKRQKKLGVIASKKVFEEAIIAIPFLERKNKNKNEAQVTTIEKQNFFKINRESLEAEFEEHSFSLGEHTHGEDKLPRSKTRKETSITRMKRLMDKYVIPPNFNFLKYDDITPFVMYIFEFSTTFNQQDLAYMWQGVMPDASLDEKEKFSEDVFTHPTGADEFFHGKEIPSDIRWMVFKVKKKARKSYSDVVNLTEVDEQDYGFNWPYDFCSLVEMAKLDVSMKITPKEQAPEPEDTKNIGKVLKGD